MDEPGKVFLLPDQLKPSGHQIKIVDRVQRQVFGGSQHAGFVRNSGHSDKPAPHFLNKWCCGFVFRLQPSWKGIQCAPGIIR